MSFLLAVDLGGTHTRFQLTSIETKSVIKQSYPSKNYPSFEQVLTAFLAEAGITSDAIISACIAVAGPVEATIAQVTNLPWTLDADALALQFNIPHIHLCNDFEAVGYGVLSVTDQDVSVLQTGEPIVDAPRVVIGAGTGLGQALLMPEGDDWKVFATEGGHVDFAPTEPQQIKLLAYLTQQFEQVSYERILSGVGLVSIYRFLFETTADNKTSDLQQALLTSTDQAATISLFALSNQDGLASQALELFIKIYGAQAGNLALNILPRAGVYIVGAIALKNQQRVKSTAFINAFKAKGKMSSLMEKMPVYLVLQQDIGLMGAHYLAEKMLKRATA